MALAFSPGNYRATGGDGGDPPFTDRVFTGSAATNCTFAMWLRRDVDQNTYGTYWGVQGTNYLALITGSNGDNLRLDSNYESSGLEAQNDPTGFLPLTTGTWYYVAVTLNGTASTLYSAELGDTTLTVADTWTASNGAPDFTHVGFGTFPQFGIQGEGSLAFYRSWSGQTLSQAELEAEMVSTVPVKTAGLWHDYRFASGQLSEDSSGNNYDINEVVGTGGVFTADPDVVTTVDLVAQDAASASTADSATLTQVHALTASDGSSSTTADPAVVAQGHVLAAADAAASTAADSATLTQAHVLVVADASSSTGGDLVMFGHNPAHPRRLYVAPTGRRVAVPVRS